MSRSYTLGEGVAGGGPSRPGRVPGGRAPLAHSRQFLFYYGQSPGSRITMTQMSRCFAGIVVWGPLGVRGLRRGLAEAATGAAAPALCPLREATAQGAGSDAGCGARGSVDSLGSRLGAVGARGAAGPPGRVARRGGAVGGRGREARPSAHVAGAPGAGSGHSLSRDSAVGQGAGASRYREQARGGPCGQSAERCRADFQASSRHW